jgi:hypothetical protein
VTPDQIQVAIENALAHNTIFSWRDFVILLVAWGTGMILGAYLTQKGKNLATKEDISAITNEIEKVRSDYKKEEHRYQLTTAGLLKKRAEVIEKLYQKIVDIEEAYNRVVDFAEWAGGPSKDELRKEAGKLLFAFLREYKQNRVYFSEALCVKLQGFVDLIYKRFMPYSIALTAQLRGDRLKDFDDTWVEANEAFKKEIPLARQAIEEEFRLLLGVL